MGFIIYRQKYSCIRWLNKIKDKPITHNIFRVQDNESIMCRFYFIAFKEYLLAGKTLLNFTNLFSPNDYKKNIRLSKNNIKNISVLKVNIVEEASLKFRLKKIDETRIYLLREIKQWFN